jgi:hypothetical protein
MTSAATAPTTTSDGPVGDLLERAAGYVHAVRTAPTPAARARAAASKDGLRALNDMMRALPRVPASFSATPRGEEMRAWFRPDRRLPFNRAPVALLGLPGSHADYLRGRPRQALRTNLKRAAEAGFRCADVGNQEELRQVTEHIAGRRGQPAEEIVDPRTQLLPDRIFSVAYDGDLPVALSHALVDGPWAGLIRMVTAVDHEHAPLVRYTLHSHLVERLIGRGVDQLVVGGSMLLTSPGTRYFQCRLGFTPVWLQPQPDGRRRRS